MLAQALMNPAPVDPYMQEYARPQERQGRLARTLMGLRELPREMVEGAPVVGDIAASVAQWAQNNPLDAGALAVSPVPVVGDVAGLANDIRHYVNDPESRTWTNYGLSALGTLPFVPPVFATFAGIGAKTADFGALAKAKELQASGAPREDIWRETGWFEGVDGNWRFEIDDSGANLTGVQEGRMSEVLDHPRLYEAYPEMANTSIMRDPDPSYLGSYNDATNVITYNPDMERDRILSVLIHEGQHGVQNAANHAPGGNPFMFQIADNSGMVEAKRRMDAADADYERLSKEIEGVTGDNIFREPGGGTPSIKTRLMRAVGMAPEPDEINYRTAQELMRARRSLADEGIRAQRAYVEAMKAAPRRSYDEMLDMYRALAGEAEARAAQGRLRMGASERAATFPQYDVPESEQIVRFRNRELANALMQSGGTR